MDQGASTMQRVARLRDPPMGVFVILGPPEELLHGNPHLLHDLPGDHEAAPRAPHDRPNHRAARPGETNADFGGWLSRPTRRRGTRVGHDVVIDKPGVGEALGQEVPQGNRPSTSRSAVHLRPDDSHLPTRFRVRSDASTGGRAASSTTTTSSGSTLWLSPLTAAKAPCERLRGIVREHKRHDSASLNLRHRGAAP